MALILTSLIIAIGFLANYLFKRTGLPDMLFLIFLGILFGPVLRVFKPAEVQGLSPYIAALALAFILFDGGIGLTIQQVLSQSPRAVLLAVLGFVFSVIVAAVFMVIAFNVPLLYGLLFGSMFGGSSSIVVISLASKIKISEKGSTTLILESAITDILCIVVSLAFIGVLINGQANYYSIGMGIAGKFLIGAAIGVLAGLIWLAVLKRVSCLPFSYMLTLAIVLFAYAISDGLGGSGGLSSLLFGLVLGNERVILKFFRRNKGVTTGQLAVDEGLKRFESEIAFLIRTFFFVFLGIIASISSFNLLMLGIVLSVLLFAVRFGVVRLTTLKSEMKKDRLIMTAVLTRGLAAAVLATLPMQYGLLYSTLFINLAVVVIVSTAIIATIGAIAISRS